MRGFGSRYTSWFSGSCGFVRVFLVSFEVWHGLVCMWDENGVFVLGHLVGLAVGTILVCM